MAQERRVEGTVLSMRRAMVQHSYDDGARAQHICRVDMSADTVTHSRALPGEVRAAPCARSTSWSTSDRTTAVLLLLLYSMLKIGSSGYPHSHGTMTVVRGAVHLISHARAAPRGCRMVAW